MRARLGANFVRKFSTQALVPYMTIELAARMGAPRAGGVVFVILALGAAANLYGGKLCERHDRVRILRMGEIAHAASLLGMLALCDQLLALIGLYLAKNLFFSISLPAGELVLVRGSAPEQRARIYALNNTLNNIAIPSGGLAGALLYGWGLRPLLALAAVAALGVLGIYGLCMSPESAGSGSPHRAQVPDNTFAALLRNRPAVYLLVSTVLLLVLEFSFDQYFAVKVAAAGAWEPAWGPRIEGARIFGVLRAELAVVSVLAAWLCLRWVERLQRTLPLAAAIALATASFIALLHVRDPAAMMLCVALMGIADAVANPVLQALYVNALPSRHYAMHLSIYALSGRFANMIAACLLAASGMVSALAVSLLLAAAGIAATGLALACAGG